MLHFFSDDRLIVFSRPLCGALEFISVEEYRGETDEKPKILMTKTTSPFTVNDVAGSCILVIDTPPLYNYVSQYHQKYLSTYSWNL